MIAPLTICAVFLLGMMLGGFSFFVYYVLIMRSPQARGALMQALSEDHPYEYSRHCQACQHAIRIGQWQNGSHNDDHPCS